MKKLILAKISNDPTRAVGYAINRVVAFGASPRLGFDKHDPQGVGITLYRATAITLNLLVTMYVVVGALTFCTNVAGRGCRFAGGSAPPCS